MTVQHKEEKEKKEKAISLRLAPIFFISNVFIKCVGATHLGTKVRRQECLGDTMVSGISDIIITNAENRSND